VGVIPDLFSAVVIRAVEQNHISLKGVTIPNGVMLLDGALSSQVRRRMELALKLAVRQNAVFSAMTYFLKCLTKNLHVSDITG
jgi:hypothetical protein